MNDEEKKVLSLSAADFLISNQLALLRLTASDGDTTLSIPTVKGINENDLRQILSNKFSPDSYTFEFEYIESNAANGTTIIRISKTNN